jgi:ABC-2 type transport system permease protein
MIKLIRSELRKIRTTNLWWIFLILVVGFTGLALLISVLQAHEYLTQVPDFSKAGPRAAELKAQWEAQRNVPGQAADIYTSGQYFGLLFVLILGALVVTNEFFHQTATTTFLTTPKRTRVIAAKLIAGVGLGACFWLVTTAIDMVVGALALNSWGFGPQLDTGTVWRAVLLNLLGYGIWAVFGIGLGVLVRSQIGTVVLAIVIYFVTGTLAQGIANVLDQLLHWHWVLKVVVALPGTASQLMIEGVKLSGNPPQWVGGVVLAAWGVAAAVVGTLLTRKRDIG